MAAQKETDKEEETQSAGMRSVQVSNPVIFIARLLKPGEVAYVGDPEGALCHIQTGKALGGHSRLPGSHSRPVAAVALHAEKSGAHLANKCDKGIRPYRNWADDSTRRCSYRWKKGQSQ